jgi:hypothetical protein
MRKVIFKRFIPTQYIGYVGEGKIVKGTGIYEEGMPNPGMFHRWVTCDDPVTKKITLMAVIEISDGSVELIRYDKLKFVDTLFTSANQSNLNESIKNILNNL